VEQFKTLFLKCYTQDLSQSLLLKNLQKFNQETHENITSEILLAQ